MEGLIDLQNQDTRSKASFRNVGILKKINRPTTCFSTCQQHRLELIENFIMLILFQISIKKVSCKADKKINSLDTRKTIIRQSGIDLHVISHPYA
jgi:hypothetical protein